jgi:integrase
MGKILPSEIQRWVTTATENGLSAASVRKYHTMLHSVVERAQRDRVVTFNPCAHTELPKVIKRKARTLAPEEYVAILTSLPAQHRLMVETAINTGPRWGELIALKPRHLDLIKRTLSVEETVVEVSIKNSPTGARMLTKPYPKDNEARTMALPADLVAQLTDRITSRCLGPDDLLFATATAPRSHGTPSAPASGCRRQEGNHAAQLNRKANTTKATVGRSRTCCANLRTRPPLDHPGGTSSPPVPKDTAGAESKDPYRMAAKRESLLHAHDGSVEGTRSDARRRSATAHISRAARTDSRPGEESV